MAVSYEDLIKKGSIVEVSSDDEGLRGSWYSATVIRACSRRTKKILVEYHRLMANETGAKPLREFVEAILVRPAPPREPPGSARFALDDDVDAFHNDGWWEGVVTQVREGSRRYSVFFRCSREQIEFDEIELRVHREWVRGGWIPPLDPNSPLPLQSFSQKPENGNVMIAKRSSNSNSRRRNLEKVRSVNFAMPNPCSQRSKKRR